MRFQKDCAELLEYAASSWYRPSHPFDMSNTQKMMCKWKDSFQSCYYDKIRISSNCDRARRMQMWKFDIDKLQFAKNSEKEDFIFLHKIFITIECLINRWQIKPLFSRNARACPRARNFLRQISALNPRKAHGAFGWTLGSCRLRLFVHPSRGGIG